MADCHSQTLQLLDFILASGNSESESWGVGLSTQQRPPSEMKIWGPNAQNFHPRHAYCQGR